MSSWHIERAQPHLETINQELLAVTFVELADTLAEDFDLIEFLYTLVERCVALLDISAVGLMLGDNRGRLRVMASSTEEMRLLELFQLQNDQGPCLECYRGGEPVDEPDLATAQDRWPLFAPHAVGAGFGAVHALPMRLRSQTVGALNLFHTDRGGLPHPHIRMAQALVDVATIGLIQVQLRHRDEVLLGQLESALGSRLIIEQAKGVLSELRGTSPAEAFTLMRARARHTGRRLTDLARAVIDAGPRANDILSDAIHAEPDIRGDTPSAQ